MLLGAALRAGTGLQGWGAENATLHRRLQLGKGTAPSPEVFLEPLLSKEEGSSPLLQSMHGLRDSRQIRDGGPRPPSLRWGAIATQKLKDVRTRIDQLQHAEKLLERATRFPIRWNESKSESEGE